MVALGRGVSCRVLRVRVSFEGRGGWRGGFGGVGVVVVVGDSVDGDIAGGRVKGVLVRLLI